MEKAVREVSLSKQETKTPTEDTQSSNTPTISTAEANVSPPATKVEVKPAESNDQPLTVLAVGRSYFLSLYYTNTTISIIIYYLLLFCIIVILIL